MKKILILLKIVLVFSFCEVKGQSPDTEKLSELNIIYNHYASQPSDINQHLPTLRKLASECESVVEIGVRSMVSTWALLQGLSENGSESRNYLGIDLQYPPISTLDLAKGHSETNGIQFSFLQANDMHIELEPADMLFIDSLHTYCHLTYELEKFSSKIGKYIVMHDTSEPWGLWNDDTYQGDYSEYPPHIDRRNRGLWRAVCDFLAHHPEWNLEARYHNNHGLTVLKRNGFKEQIESLKVKEIPKIYDCFPFFNELEILSIRLNELYDHVDKFVIVEARETFRGNPKPLFFEENKHLFEKYKDKIIHVVIDEYFDSYSPWSREAFQRDQISRGLKECKDHDIILISDADEIPNISSLTEMRKLLCSGDNKKRKMVLCKQFMYRYFFNRFDHYAHPWPGTVALTYKDLKTLSPEVVRVVRGETPLIMENAGWHLTYMGGLQRVINKLAAFSHIECDTPENRELEEFYRKAGSFQLVQIDKTFPKLVYENQEEWKTKGFIDLR